MDEIKQESIVEQPKEIVQPSTQISEENEINWRKFREQREADRKAALEAQRLAAEEKKKNEALERAMAALVNQKSSIREEQREPEEQDHIRSEFQKMWDQAQREQEEKMRQREMQELPVKLNQAYSDFGSVCSQENLDYLEYHYPEIAKAFAHVPESFQKWADVYKAIKRFVPNPQSKKDENKAIKNMNKPQSSSVGGVTQTGDHAPAILSEQRRNDNWKRMQRVLKGL